MSSSKEEMSSSKEEMSSSKEEMSSSKEELILFLRKNKAYCLRDNLNVNFIHVEGFSI